VDDGAGVGSALLAEGRRRYEAGDIAEVEPLARAAVANARDAGRHSPTALAAALQLLGEVLFSAGRYPEARAAADEVAAIRVDATPVDRAETLNLLGVVDLALSDPATALGRLEEALALREAHLGPEDPDTLEALNNAAVALARLDRLPEANERNRETLRRWERAGRPAVRAAAMAMNSLAVRLAGDAATLDEAIALYGDALDAANAAVGPEHPLVATLTSNLATAYVNAGRFDEARPWAERSIDLHERHYGHDHPNTATALLTAANVAAKGEQPEVARAMIERAVRIRLAVFGFADERTRAATRSLAAARQMRVDGADDNAAEAIALFEIYRAITPGAAGLGSGTRPLAADEAERQLRLHLDRVRTAAAPDPALVAARDDARQALATADRAMVFGDLAAAETAVALAIDLLAAVPSGDARDLIEPLLRRAGLERGLGRTREALATQAEAADLLARIYGEHHVWVIRGFAMVAVETERELGAAAARPWFERILGATADARPGSVAEFVRRRVERRLGRGDRDIDDGS
jgi:tetratricopeptide (TPR) repeat protein